MKNKIFARIIITTLLVTFLTFNVGRVTRVSAVASTAAIAGAAFVATGLIFVSYCALTGASIPVPDTSGLNEWLGDLGRKVSKYPCGADAYSTMYQYLINPAITMPLGVWSWTEERIKDFVRYFSNTEVINDMLTFERTLTYEGPLNGYTYPGALIETPYRTTSGPLPNTFQVYSGARVAMNSSVSHAPSGEIMIGHAQNLTGALRNYTYNSGNTYSIQQQIGDIWYDVSNLVWGGMDGTSPYVNYYSAAYNNYYYFSGRDTANVSTYSYPPLLDYPIYDQVTDTTTDLVPATSTELTGPSWTDPDNDNKPIIPYVPIPQLPANIEPPSGYNDIDQWGINLNDLLDTLEQLGLDLFDLSILTGLINDFAGLHGDNYYIEFNDGDTNYYTYYQPVVYDDDYITYNIDVSDVDKHLPIDLNEIQLYTKNQYVDSIKSHATNFGELLGEYVVFWHNVDPESLYTILGSFVIIIIGAFIGKWGHS